MTHVTPVVYIFDGQRIYFNTSKEAKKMKMMKKNRKVAFLIDKRDTSNIYENKALLVTGEVRIYGLCRYSIQFQSRCLRLVPYSLRNIRITQENTPTSELPKAWQLTPIIARILVEIKPIRIIYWRGAKTDNCASVIMKIPDEMLNILYGNYFGYVVQATGTTSRHITPVFFVL